jgi:hypothetical protein
LRVAGVDRVALAGAAFAGADFAGGVAFAFGAAPLQAALFALPGFEQS